MVNSIILTGTYESGGSGGSREEWGEAKRQALQYDATSGRFKDGAAPRSVRRIGFSHSAIKQNAETRVSVLMVDSLQKQPRSDTKRPCEGKISVQTHTAQVRFVAENRTLVQTGLLVRAARWHSTRESGSSNSHSRSNHRRTRRLDMRKRRRVVTGLSDMQRIRVQKRRGEATRQPVNAETLRSRNREAETSGTVTRDTTTDRRTGTKRKLTNPLGKEDTCRGRWCALRNR